jgi:hypothetical protein
LHPRKSALGAREGCLMKTSRWLERKYGYRSKLRGFRIRVTATKTFDGKGGIEFGFYRFGFYQGLEEAHGIEEACYGRDGMGEACKNSYANDLSYLGACSFKRQRFSLK